MITPAYLYYVFVLFGSYEMQLRKPHQSYVTRKVSIYFMTLFSASKLSKTNACVILSDSDAFHTDDMTSLIWRILNVKLPYFICCNDKKANDYFCIVYLKKKTIRMTDKFIELFDNLAKIFKDHFDWYCTQ